MVATLQRLSQMRQVQWSVEGTCAPALLPAGTAFAATHDPRQLSKSSTSLPSLSDSFIPQLPPHRRTAQRRTACATSSPRRDAATASVSQRSNSAVGYCNAVAETKVSTSCSHNNSLVGRRPAPGSLAVNCQRRRRQETIHPTPMTTR